MNLSKLVKIALINFTVVLAGVGTLTAAVANDPYDQSRGRTYTFGPQSDFYRDIKAKQLTADTNSYRRAKESDMMVRNESSAALPDVMNAYEERQGSDYGY